MADRPQPRPPRQLLEKETALQLRGLNPPRIELTEFADKRDLCKRLLSAGRKRFDREMDGLRNLRDQLAHAATFVDEEDGSAGIGWIRRPVGCRALLGPGVDGADREGKVALVLIRVQRPAGPYRFGPRRVSRGRPTRLSKAWKRESERSPSKMGLAFNVGISHARPSAAFASHSNARSLSSRPV